MFISPISINNNYNCSFGSRNIIKKRVLKDLPGVCCPYCGQKMLTSKQIGEYCKRVTKLCGNDLIKLLEEISKHSKPQEKVLLPIMIEGAKKNPKLNLQGILLNIAPRHLKRLIKNQMSIFQQIETASEKFSEKDRNLAKAIVYSGLVKIEHGVNGKPFKLKDFLSEFYKTRSLYENEKSFNIVADILHNMPKSTTDKDAFIVKYSRRESSEIVNSLLKPNLATIEHLNPHSIGGSSEMSNLVLACQRDNNRRKNNPLETMTSLRVNIFKFLKSVRESFARKYSLSDNKKLEEYIKAIKRTINSLLKEPIRFNDTKRR